MSKDDSALECEYKEAALQRKSKKKLDKFETRKFLNKQKRLLITKWLNLKEIKRTRKTYK